MICNETLPPDFNPTTEVAAVHCFCDNHILLLKRAPGKKVEPDKWGVPGGKIYENESKYAAALREMYEETGLDLEQGKMVHLRSVPVRYPGFDFIFHIFRYDLETFPEEGRIKLTPEHTEYAWTKLADLESWDLMMDELACIKLIDNK